MIRVGLVVWETTDDLKKFRPLANKSVKINEADFRFLDEIALSLADKLLTDVALESLGRVRSTTPFSEVVDESERKNP